MWRTETPMMDPIRRGTTPTLRLKTPYSASIITGGYVTFAQRGAVLFEKTFDDDSVEVFDNLVKVSLTQEETLGLTPVDYCKVQLRFNLKYEKTAAGDIYEIPVLDILKGGKI